MTATKKRRGAGEGTIDPRGPDAYRLRYQIAGKRFTKSIHGTLGDAKRELRRLLKTVDDGTHIGPDKRTMAQWTGEWLELIRTKVTPRTRERYSELLAGYVLPSIGGRRIQALDVSELDQLYRRLGERVSVATVRHVHVCIKAALKVAVDKGQLRGNAAARATVPKHVDPMVGQALTSEELKRLLDGFRGSPMFPLIATAALTGARLGEILALKWSDLDPAAKTLRIERALEVTRAHGIRFKGPKSERGKRTITIDGTLLSVLLAERDKHLRLVAGIGSSDVDVALSLVRLPADALMFPRLDGDLDLTQPRAPKSATKGPRRRFRALGFATLRFHDLRGSHGTALLDAGVPVHVVAGRLGHDPAVLLRAYAKRTGQSDAAAADVINKMAGGILT
jgi:integrase